MTTITLPRAVVEQALEALRELLPDARDPNCGGYDARDVRQWRATAGALRAALAQQDERDWSLLEATQESLREHMAEIHRLRAALAQRAEPVTEDMKSAVRWAPSSAYWSERLREFFGPDAREGIAALERRLAEAQQAEPVEPAAWTDRERRVVRFALRCFISQALDRHAAAAQDVRGMWFKPGDHLKFYQDAEDATSALTKMGAAEPLGVPGGGHLAAPPAENHSPQG